MLRCILGMDFYEIKFNASNIASRTYFYRIKPEILLKIKKMVLIK
jgi:hypothetical protein